MATKNYDEFRREIINTLRRRLELIRSRITISRNDYYSRLGYKYSAHIDQVVRYVEIFGSISEAEDFLKTSEKDVFRTIRTNTLKTSREELMKRLKLKGLQVREYDPTPYGIIVEEGYEKIGFLHEYLYGFYTIQGPASMLPVIALRPSDDDRIADMCAGAGIKTTQISQHAPRSIIVATDVNRRKLQALKNNASRLGVFNILALRMDARHISRLSQFDKILLDAPCSGEGLWPFPKGRWKRRFEDIASRTFLQIELLLEALKASKRSTVIVYSTCSISVEENELLIDTILEHMSDSIEVEEIRELKQGAPGIQEYAGIRFRKELRRCKRYYPHRHSTEGFTICRLRVNTPTISP